MNTIRTLKPRYVAQFQSTGGDWLDIPSSNSPSRDLTISALTCSDPPSFIGIPARIVCRTVEITDTVVLP